MCTNILNFGLIICFYKVKIYLFKRFIDWICKCSSSIQKKIVTKNKCIIKVLIYKGFVDIYGIVGIIVECC